MQVKNRIIWIIVSIAIVVGVYFFILHERKNKILEERLSRIPSKEVIEEMIVRRQSEKRIIPKVELIKEKVSTQEFKKETDCYEDDGDACDHEDNEEDNEYECEQDPETINYKGESICKDDYDFRVELNEEGNIDDEKVKEFLIAGLMEWHDGDKEEQDYIDYSGAVDAEFVYVRDPNYGDLFNRIGFYKGIILNQYDEVIADVGLNVVAYGDNSVYLAISTTAPWGDAFISEPSILIEEQKEMTLEEIKEKESYPYGKKIFPVSEEQAINNLFDYFKQRIIVPTEVEMVGDYTVIYTPENRLIGGEQPFYEYIITDEKGDVFPVWVSAVDESVFDYDRLEWVDERASLWEEKFGDKFRNGNFLTDVSYEHFMNKMEEFEEVEYVAKPKKK